ncbi:MAG: hypothetical protein ACI865_000085 [Flavobacteriaceae bacterium]
MPSEMLIRRAKSRCSRLGTGQWLMVDTEGRLLLWEKGNGRVTILRYPHDFVNEHEAFEFEISKLRIGVTIIENDLALESFVTYVRSEKIKYAMGFYETFGVLIINGNNIELRPFDEFNESNPDYGYVWPAVAQIDVKNNFLIGGGKRMTSFKYELRKKEYNTI